MMAASTSSSRRTAPSSVLEVHSGTAFLPRAELSIPRRKAAIIYMFLMLVHGVRMTDLKY
jgi:hypothetical protein